MNTRRIAGALLGAGLLSLALGTPANAASEGRALLVCSESTANCPAGTEFRKIDDAAKAAKNGDWIMLWPGKYERGTTISKTTTLTRDLHIRGLDRNKVVLQGTNTAKYGIKVDHVDRVWIQNMTARDHDNNAFHWDGVKGYWGTHLTSWGARKYGIFAYNSSGPVALPGEDPKGLPRSMFADSYGAWSGDSAFYIGECRDCGAEINNVISENNAVGYSGTNAGGDLHLINSTWRNNGSGILPNVLTSEKDLPQNGSEIANNLIENNNNNKAPRIGSTYLAPVGHGIVIAGGANNIIRNNVIKNHRHNGVSTTWLFTPTMSNQIRNNQFIGNGDAYTGDRGGSRNEQISRLGDVDISIGLLGFDECVTGNTRIDPKTGAVSPATTDPANFQNMQECHEGNPGRDRLGKGIYQPGSATSTATMAANVATLTEDHPSDVDPLYTELAKYGVGPGPSKTDSAGASIDAMQGMENPCAGAPDSAW